MTTGRKRGGFTASSGPTSPSSSDLSPLDAAPEFLKLVVPDDEQGEGRLSSILPIHLPRGGPPEIERPEQRPLLAHRHRLTLSGGQSSSVGGEDPLFDGVAAVEDVALRG